MANRGEIRFSARWRNEVAVKAKLAAFTTSAGLIFGQKRLEKLLLRRTKSRFDEYAGPGSASNAQRDPSGKKWPDLAPSTLRTHPNPNRMLYRTGALLKSIVVLRSRMGQSVLQSNTGGGFRIGVRPGSPAEEYARDHQFGNPEDNLPARRFLGVSKEDLGAVDNFIERNTKRMGIRITPARR